MPMVMDRVAWKISVSGSKGSGKSSLISRIVYDSDGTSSASKLLSRKRITVERDGVRIPADLLLQEISDEPEAERLLPGSNIILILADVTSAESLATAVNMIKYARSFEKRPPLVLVGTKSDMKYEAEIWIEDFDRVKQKTGVDYFMVSARTGDGVRELMEGVTATLLERFYAKRQRAP